MSWWTYVNGMVTVSPMGRTQAEKRYILETVLNHLPRVTGSERDMRIYIIQKEGESSSCSHDEFGEVTNNLTDRYGDKSYREGWLRMQDEYILVVEGKLRDRMFDETLKEFQKWICRLAKRVSVIDAMVEIEGYEQCILIRNKHDVYYKMFEEPSWSSRNIKAEPNWCEFLMWDSAKNSNYPMLLGYKYFNDEENDREVERRMKYLRE